jgi:hypothetical protein
MNYKIRITADNQAIVKRIADENGMNPNMFDFMLTKKIYIIKENKFYVGNVGYNENIFLDYPELTTEQFIELFDKKETELDKWLKKTKAKNLSLEELRDETNFLDTKFYNQIRRELKVVGTLYQHLFNLWNNQTEWQPKRGDRVLVSNLNDNEVELIFVTKIEGSHYPYVVVNPLSEDDFYNNLQFNTSCYKHMKPLPIEQPKETDFKTKVIELIEKENQKALVHYDESINSRNYLDAHAYGFKSSIYKELIEKIKQL